MHVNEIANFAPYICYDYSSFVHRGFPMAAIRQTGRQTNSYMCQGLVYMYSVPLWIPQTWFVTQYKKATEVT